MSIGVPPATATAAEFHQAFVGLVRAFGLHQPDSTPCGQPVPTSEAHALLELDGEPSLTQNELAHRLRLQKSTVSRLVAQLENKHWLQRERDTRDRRARRLQLTDAGREVARAINTARTEKFERLVAAIPSEERSGVIETLRLLAHVSEQDKE
jgi:DNA-binding MarR family transcriptional regulator